MKKNNPNLIEEEIDIKDVFNSIWKNKILVICVVVIVTIFFSLKSTEKKTYTINTLALIQKPPEYIFVNFINSNEKFFRDLYKEENNFILAKNESQLFYDMFILKFISTDYFSSFIKTKNTKLYNEILNEKKNNILQKKIGIRNIDITNVKGTKELGPTRAEEVFLKLNSNYDGPQILSDYIYYVFNDTIKDYIEQKRKDFNEILKRYEKALEVSNNLGIEKPLFMQQGVYLNNEDVKLSSFFSTVQDLYFKGSEILKSDVEYLRQKIVIKNLNLLPFEPIIDSPYNTISNNSEVPGKMTNLVRGFITGIFIALIIVYLKSLMITKKSIKKKRS